MRDIITYLAYDHSTSMQWQEDKNCKDYPSVAKAEEEFSNSSTIPLENNFPMGIFWNIMEYSKILQDIMEYSRSLYILFHCILEYSRIFQNVIKYSKVFKNIQNNQKYMGIFWNILDY